MADKIGWRVQYQDRVVDGPFQVRVPDLGLLYFDGQLLTLVLGGRYERNESAHTHITSALLNVWS